MAPIADAAGGCTIEAADHHGAVVGDGFIRGARPSPHRRDRKMPIWCQWLTAIGSAIGMVFASASAAHADPPAEAPPNPFPEMASITAWYTELPPDQFLSPDNSSLWFLTPTGLTCGIWFWGGFGCTGDIPGAPPGDTHIAWFNGNRAVHHGWTAAIQFPAGHAEQTLPPRSYVTFNSTTCAITPDGDTYCGHGEFKFLITPQGTWFKAWDDRRSYVCNAYNSCPPG